MFPNECKESLYIYLQLQNLKKAKLAELQYCCPDLVLRYLLKFEQKNTIDKLLKCEFEDKFNKKLYIDISNMDTCERLKKII